MGVAKRLGFIDWLRGLAVVVMIEVHVVNALLEPALRRTSLFQGIDAVNGLVAPAFLVAAGFGLARTLEKAWTDPSAWKPLLARHGRRSVELLAFGYLLHASPLLGLVRGPASDAAREGAWRQFFQADILQVIALTLLAIVLIAAALRSRRRFIVASVMLAVVLILATPFVRAIDPPPGPIWIQSFFSDRVPSQFPLFPWAGFAVVGAAIGALEVTAVLAWGRAFGALSAGAFGTTALLSPIPEAWFPQHDFWTVGPAFVCLRLGLVGLLAAGLAFWEGRRRVHASPPSHIDRALRVLGERSLLVYLVHVAVVYGRHPFSFRSLLGPTLGFFACFAVWMLVTLAMLALAVVRGRASPSRRLLLP